MGLRHRQVADAAEETGGQHQRPGPGARRRVPLRQRHRRQHDQRAHRRDQLHRVRRLGGRHAARQQVERGVDEGLHHRQQDRRVEGVRTRPYHQQHTGKAGQHGEPAPRVQPFLQPPGRQQRDQDRHRELDRPRLGQLQVLQGPEVQARHRRQHRAAQQVQLDALHVQQRRPAARQQQRQHQQHVGGEAQPHHLGHRHGLHQPLGHRVERGETQRRHGDERDAPPPQARFVGNLHRAHASGAGTGRAAASGCTIGAHPARKAAP